MSGKAKKLEILKNETQTQVKIFWENFMFWSETFIQVFLENFLYVSRTHSRYLGSPLNLVLALVKNRDHTTHKSDDISKKVLGETMPYLSMFKINQSLHNLLHQKMSCTCYERIKPETDLKSFVIAYCHFEQLFKCFCWTINSAKFSLLREKILFCCKLI